MPDAQWSIVVIDEEAHTQCPHCQALDTIVEQDSAIRWNRLDLSNYPDEVIALCDDDGAEWGFEQWYCIKCGSTPSGPDDFQIDDWV